MNYLFPFFLRLFICFVAAKLVVQAVDLNTRVYLLALTVLFLVFFGGFVRVLALRRRLGTKGGRGPVAALAMVVIMLLVMNELPYRLLWRSFAIRGEYEGRRIGPRAEAVGPFHVVSTTG